MARSSSNRKSARDLASSVLPTPVGPRNRNEPVGRLGSETPARARRIASDTVSTAFFWPMSRLPMCSSACSSFSRSPSSRRPAGMPVHDDTTSAMSSAVTCSPTICLVWPAADSASSAAAISFSTCGISPYSRREAVSRSVSRRAISAWLRRSSSFCRSSPRRFKPARCDSHAAVRPDRVSCLSARSSRRAARRSFEASSVSADRAISSILRRSTSRCSWSISTGAESISMRRRLAASSTRSIALSGSCLSVM